MGSSLSCNVFTFACTHCSLYFYFHFVCLILVRNLIFYEKNIFTIQLAVTNKLLAPINGIRRINTCSCTSSSAIAINFAFLSFQDNVCTILAATTDFWPILLTSTSVKAPRILVLIGQQISKPVFLLYSLQLSTKTGRRAIHWDVLSLIFIQHRAIYGGPSSSCVQLNYAKNTASLSLPQMTWRLSG